MKNELAKKMQAQLQQKVSQAKSEFLQKLNQTKHEYNQKLAHTKNNYKANLNTTMQHVSERKKDFDEREVKMISELQMQGELVEQQKNELECKERDMRSLLPLNH